MAKTNLVQNLNPPVEPTRPFHGIPCLIPSRSRPAAWSSLAYGPPTSVTVPVFLSTDTMKASVSSLY